MVFLAFLHSEKTDVTSLMMYRLLPRDYRKSANYEMEGSCGLSRRRPITLYLPLEIATAGVGERPSTNCLTEECVLVHSSIN